RPAFIFTVLHVAKPVCAYFDCTVILDRINLEGVSDKLPCHVVPLCKHAPSPSARILPILRYPDKTQDRQQTTNLVYSHRACGRPQTTQRPNASLRRTSVGWEMPLAIRATYSRQQSIQLSR